MGESANPAPTELECHGKVLSVYQAIGFPGMETFQEMANEIVPQLRIFNGVRGRYLASERYFSKAIERLDRR